MRGRWTFTGAILSLVSGFESNGVDVDSAMVDDDGSMPMRVVRLDGEVFVVWCGWGVWEDRVCSVLRLYVGKSIGSVISG
jgi:hypothetical protein